jgi:general secretion pathway protein J
VIILRKIKSLKFAYFGFDNAAEDSDSSWQNDWLEKENLPSLVSIDVE